MSNSNEKKPIMRNSHFSFENREGYFDMSMEDSTDPNIHVNIVEDGYNTNDIALESHIEAERDLTSYFPIHLDRMSAIRSEDLYNSTPIPKKELAKTRTEKILDRIHKRAPPRIIRRILKCSIAYFISTLFSTIYPIAIALGRAPYIACTGCLLCHPGRTMGAQFDATITAALGAGFAIIYGLAGVAAATAYNVSHPESYAGAAINCIFLVVGIFGAQLIRQAFPKLSVFSVQFMIVQLFTLTNGIGFKEVPMDLSSQFGFSLIVGNFVSLIANLVFWPETAVDGLGRILSDTLFDAKQMLDTITRQSFFLDPTPNMEPAEIVDELAEKMRQGMLKVNTAYHEAKYEVSYAYSCSSDLNPIRHSLYRITKHLSILSGSLKSKQVLFRDANFFKEDCSLNFDKNHKRHSSKTTSNGNSSDENASQQQSENHSLNNTHNTRDEHLRRSALEATISYMKDGTYSRPSEKGENQDKPLSGATLPQVDTTLDNRTENLIDNVDDNDVRVDDHSTTVSLQQKSQPISTAVQPGSNSDEEKGADNIERISSKRKSHPTSYKSFFSTLSDANTSIQANIDEHKYNDKEEEDYSDTNQYTASSLKSFFKFAGLSTPKPRLPQRSEKKFESSEKHLLLKYLEKLRGPLLLLSIECAAVMDCVRDSLNEQLDLPNDDDTGYTHKNFWRYILHTLQIKTINNEEHMNYLNKKKRSASFLCNCAETMRLRIAEFDKREKERMQALYNIDLRHMKGQPLDSGIREELFLVFFFIFTLREIALELQEMAQDMKNLQIKTQSDIQANRNQTKKKKKLFMPRVTIQTWRKWFYSNSYQNVKDRGGYTFSHFQSSMSTEADQRGLEDEYRLNQLALKRNEKGAASNKSLDEASGSSRDGRKFSIRKRDIVANNVKNDSDSLTKLESGEKQPETNHIDTRRPPPLLRIRFKLWLCVRYIQGYEFKFALKLSFAVGALTVPVYIPESYDWFNVVRGQWAALTVIMIMSPTSGGTLSSGLWRLVGTLIGAFAGWAILAIDDTSAYLLSGFAFFFAIPSFYVHFSTSYNKVAIIVLTTYMVIVLGHYVTPEYNETVEEKVWKRTATLIVGLAAALFLNWMVWPFIARDAVRTTLGGTIGDLGDYFSYVMGTFLYHGGNLSPTEDELKEAQKTERKLERMLNTCNELLQLTDHEPRLKGPFAKEFYKEILVSTQNVLDSVMGMRIALMNMSPEVKQTVRNMDKYLYRRDMVASILLHFYTLSSSLKAKIPLPSYMPSARNARSRLLKHRNQEDRPEKLLCYQNLTWFAMACTTEEIIDELEHLTDLIRFIVGESKFSLKARRLDKRM